MKKLDNKCQKAYNATLLTKKATKMGDLINGYHKPCTKEHWCENHCRKRLESEGGMPSCECDEFEEDDYEEDIAIDKNYLS